MASNIPTGTVTFLFTDIEGSTKLWEDHPAQMKVDLAGHDGLLRRAIETNAGHVFKTVGDAFCAAFSFPSEAVSASVEIQKTLQSAQWQVPGAIRVRMAMHVGEVESRDDDYFGPTVNRVARLLSAAHGGQTLLSAAMAELVKDALPNGMSLLALGSHRLKDLGQPQQVYQLMHPDLAREFPALLTLDSRPNNLLPQPTALIGREKELANILGLIRQEGVRLVTLTGPGGIGKTRLAVQVGAELVDEFEHGVFSVDLSILDDSERVLPLIAQELKIKEPMGEGRPLKDILQDSLKNKKLLLVLDNFEQVLSAGPRVAEFFGAVPALKLLVTSREPLHVRGEREFPVPPLSCPPRGKAETIDRLAQYEAVRLFIERATAVMPDFEVTNESAPAVAEICARLDGLPLAIELAAARLKILTPDALLERLADRLQLLKGGARDLPARQQTLRATIDWSYNLLDVEEKRLFARLSVFVGGWTLDAAEYVCKGSTPELEILDGVASLVDKSLVRREETEDRPRFTILETIGEYAREILKDIGELESIGQRHARYFLDLADEAELELHGPNQKRQIDMLDREYDNLHAAFEWFLDRRDVGAVLHLNASLCWFWYIFCRFIEGHQWTELSLAAAEGTGPTKAKARVLLNSAMMHLWLGQYAPSQVRCDESVTMCRQIGDKQGLAESLTWRNVLLWWQRKPVTRENIESSVTIAREIGDPWTLAFSLVWNYGGELRQDVDKELLCEGLEESVGIFRQIGDAWDLGLALLFLGNVYRDSLCAYDAAGTAYMEALSLSRKLGHSWLEMYVLRNLGFAKLREGNHLQAEEHLRQAKELFVEVGNKRGAADLLSGLGIVAGVKGDHQYALECLMESLLLVVDFEIGYDMALTMIYLAVIYRSINDHSRAALFFGAISVFIEMNPEIAINLEYSVKIRCSLNTKSIFADYKTQFAHEWVEGRAMSLKDAVELAIKSGGHAVRQSAQQGDS